MDFTEEGTSLAVKEFFYTIPEVWVPPHAKNVWVRPRCGTAAMLLD